MPEGLFDKYIVTKKEGPTDPNAVYFVLRLDTDVNARIAALHYSTLVESKNPKLSQELFDLVLELWKKVTRDAAKALKEIKK